MMTNARTEFSYPEESPGFLLWQVSNLWQKLQRKALSELNLTHVQFALTSTHFNLAFDHLKDYNVIFK